MAFPPTMITIIVLLLSKCIGQLRWLIRSGCGSKLGSGICHRGCAYAVLRTVQRSGVCVAVYGTVQIQAVVLRFSPYTGCSRFYLVLLADQNTVIENEITA